jgi:very-short-patch-repair endonuclease
VSSTLERTFDYWYRLLADDLPEPATEYRFDARRRWRFDCAWPDYLLAVELHGGTYTNGRHTRGAGMAADCEKMNAATLKGWRVLTFTTDMLNNDPQTCIAQVRALLEAEGPA